MPHLLAASPELLARAAEESAGALYITDLAHRIIWANAAFERAFGYSVAEVLGQVPTMLIGHEVDPALALDIIATLDRGERVSTSLVFRRKDGTTFWSALAVAPLIDAEGQRVGYLSNSIDITPTKAAEQRLANILAGTRAGTWEWNVQSGETHFNERWAEMIGYRLDELQPVNIDTWMHHAHPDDLPRSSAMLERHFSGQSDHYDCLCRMRHRDGHDVWVHDRGQVVSWTPDGKPLWMAGTHIDVTEMVLTSEALREARDKAQHVLDTVQSVIISLDREGRVLQLNPAGCALVGVTERDVRGRNWFTDFHPPEHVDRLVTAYRQLMMGDVQQVALTENEILTAHGRRLLRWRHVLQRDESGSPSGLLSSGDDITELRQLERMATRRQRLESIGTLAGGIAHDLNNALSPAVMGMGLLRDAAPREGQLLDMIESSTKRAAQMVRQLLAFARGAEGERRSTDLPSIIREVERLARTTFPKNIALAIDVSPAVPPIMGDATQMHQVLVNLAVNARDAMPDGGLLAISAQVVDVTAEEASRVSLAAARAGRFVRLTVRDSGEGIPPEVSDRIFDPFFSTKGPDRGTGLGLSTVLGIVKGHDGFLQVDSQPGIGSAFHVYVPLPDAPVPARPVAPSDADPPAPSGSILFVDDEPFIRSMAGMLAHRVGYEAKTVSSTEEALSVLSRSAASYTTVVTDLHMPGRDGLSLAREVRERWPDLPVVIVTGLMTDALWQEVGRLSRVSVLPKPFSEQQLRTALERSAVPPEPVAPSSGA